MQSNLLRRCDMDDLKCLDCGAEFEELDMNNSDCCPNCSSDNYEFVFDLDFNEEQQNDTEF